MYSEKVLQMFRDSKHYGKIENADGLGKVGNPKCGDVMWIYIKVDNGIITDAKFETFGCVAAIATSSMAIEMVKGKPVDEALKLTNKAVAEALDGLPPEKMHCSLLAEEGIKSAIEDYNTRQKDAA
ncbi:MAG: Fe-S cluster assembly scaffold protein NifU [Candidatus Aminicenantes bacterium]|nr:MAG: Fe-S cluster assembly scaffold protein NifU [Candidatus Aminicenantes bacterium]